ncbi:MAG: recombinase family protein [Patescibacteria group bacterium]
MNNPAQQAVPVPQPIRYCLYSRKSTEQDEQQSLSIESQVKEMLAAAERDGLLVTEIRRESHSAKASGQRPEFNRLIDDIRLQRFDGILAWAPDRLSRNAGDLGTIVDLMDQGVIREIRTNGSRFTNSPSDKFMLMMLCSQAKLENDNKSINIKRGLKAKVEMGYRPNMAPMGYLHDKNADKGTKRIYIDPERAPGIREMFEKVGYRFWSGRQVKRWLDNDAMFRSRTGRKVALSSIYMMLSNPFYTGRYEFPMKSGKWYKGKHDAIISQELFDRVQENLSVIPKGTHGSKEFSFTRLFSCGACGAGITAEEKVKRLKDGTVKRYVYYHCTKQVDRNCRESFLREESLIEQLLKIVDKLSIDELGMAEIVKAEMEKFQRLLVVVSKLDSNQQNIMVLPKLDVRACAKLILQDGSKEDKRKLLEQLKSRIILKGGKLSIEKKRKT